ncbi:MAG TPA: FtsX-like permease family protein [Rectinemataceae bacterium]|nr:FtsX-like permease family protein [Rectinemataceae bacterium]
MPEPDKPNAHDPVALKRGVSPNIALKRIPAANLLSLAFLNVRRHGLRAAVNIAGIAITVAALVFFLSFYRGTYEGTMFSSVIDYATSHGQFMSASFDDDDPDVWLKGENLIDESMARSDLLGAVPSRDADWSPVAAPRLMSPALAGDGARVASVTLAGVVFPQEARLLAIDDRMVAGAFGDGVAEASTGPRGVVIGKKLAQTLSLAAGDEIRIQATTTDGASNLDYWKISGIYSTGYPSLDRAMVMMDLAEAQDFLNAGGKINKIYCRLAEGKSSVDRRRALASLETESERKRFADLGLRFRSWENYAKAIVEDAKADSFFYAIFIVILLFLSLSTMAGTMRVTVFERKREIGMMRATGWLRNEITELFLFEALVIGIVGSLAGCCVGGIASLWLEFSPLEFSAALASFDIPRFSLSCDLQPVDILISLAVGFVTAMLAGISPALTAARMPILSALSER